ncbi:MAG: hypothetical protein ACRDC4_09860 [Plesiomonas sp.]
MPQGRNYINKYYFDMNKDWTVESITQKMEEMGLRFNVNAPVISVNQFNQLQARGNYNLVIYTHRSKDDATQVRRSFVRSHPDLAWYTDREWVEVEGGKAEIPY